MPTLSTTGARSLIAVTSQPEADHYSFRDISSLDRSELSIPENRGTVNFRRSKKGAGTALRSATEARIQSLQQRLRIEIRKRKELLAVNRLQIFFRRYIQGRHQVVHRSLIPSFRMSAMKACVDRMDRIQWRWKEHRRKYVILVPRVIACLDAICMQFEYVKAQASNRLMRAEHKDLEARGEAAKDAQ